MNSLIEKEKIMFYRSKMIVNERTYFVYNEDSYFVFRCIKNYGSTCYLGSILQCLNVYDNILREMVIHMNKNNWFYCLNACKLFKNYCELFYNGFNTATCTRSNQYIKVLDEFFKEFFKTKFFNNRFTQGQQHDTYEFLLKFFEYIDLCVVDVELIKRGLGVNDNLREIYKDLMVNHNIIQKLFKCELTRVLTCRKLHSKRDLEYSFTYELPINNSCHTLNDCLDLFFAKEYIEDLVECEECGKRTQFDSQYFIKTTKDNLILYIKRFEVDWNFLSK